MNEKGFTLLELLLGITILSLIAVIVGGTFRLGIRAWQRGESDVNYSQRQRILVERLSQQIRSAYPYTIKIEDKRVVAFQGMPDSLWFITSSTSPSEAGLKWVSYFTRDGSLIVNEGVIPDKKILDKVIPNEGKVLDSEVSDLHFEYLSPHEKEWEESWDLTGRLPEAVKIKINQFQEFVIHIPFVTSNGKK